MSRGRHGPAEHTLRARRLFDEALAQSVDALFARPDAVAVVSAVAEGDLAIVITGDSLHVIAVTDANVASPAPQQNPETPGTGCYL
ncbi:hypothetical protein [Nocardioides sp.]|uniref:hypothetical protein n=1 Tax=Nocardioides sp. TaxID=35761 RepID=UPI002622EA87|nr:hypothetical protein [Nocardioides sp.]MDI6912201.1 hypothetical protein [Nocardioides sp.]